ncbi:MAG: hypothetical protein LBF83_11805 [Spirochaetaceae bacterium]|nr:hypothetical protein [Spirochaetaceae bacterium]
MWYEVDEEYAFVIFIDDVFISNVDGGFSLRYSVEDNNLIMNNPRTLGIDGVWDEIQTENEKSKIQYVFSGDRLILIFDGEPMTLSRVPEW